MTRVISISFKGSALTRAGTAQAGPHSITADRPDGIAGGQGLGFNGGQLLASAIGGCFWNDLHYAAEAQTLDIKVHSVSVDLTLDGDPPLIRSAMVKVDVEGTGAQMAFDEAIRASTVANSVKSAVPVTFERAEP